MPDRTIDECFECQQSLPGCEIAGAWFCHYCASLVCNDCGHPLQGELTEICPSCMDKLVKAATEV